MALTIRHYTGYASPWWIVENAGGFDLAWCHSEEEAKRWIEQYPSWNREQALAKIDRVVAYADKDTRDLLIEALRVLVPELVNGWGR